MLRLLLSGILSVLLYVYTFKVDPNKVSSNELIKASTLVITLAILYPAAVA